ncbi:MAG: GyrI-like domain-containing protein [Planctomycetota bacterium]
MKIVKYAAGALVAVILAVVIIAAYYGIFAEVTIREQDQPALILIYKKHIGSYSQVGKVMDELFSSLKKDNAETTKGFGIYYDNPQNTPAEKLRSVVGCILEEKDRGRVNELKAKYKIQEFPATQVVCSEFPFKGKMSILFGIMKVYPRMFAYISGKGYANTPIMEIYDTPNKKIEYIAAKNVSESVFNSFLDD